MISSEVQRTLVKSPPELWAELSDPESLSRHLGELGEIRITRSEPEKRVDWESQDSSGSILIKPSGWGTKVTLSATREVILAAGDPNAETEPAVETEPAAETGFDLETDAERATDAGSSPPAELQAEPSSDPDAVSAAEKAEEPAPAGTTSAPLVAAASEEPRRGFFARLFARRKPSPSKMAPTPSLDEPLVRASAEMSAGPAETASPEAVSASTPAVSQETTSSAIETLQARFHAEAPVQEPAQEDRPTSEEDEPSEGDPADSGAAEGDGETPPVDIAAELEAAEEVAVEEVTALLTGVLDRLGAAHHRPFSRA